MIFCLLGSYNGILLLKKENNQWVFKKRLDGFDESAGLWNGIPLEDFG
jgi:hypothetical protein